MIRRPPRSTQSRSSAASDVYKRQPVVESVLAPPGPIPNPVVTRHSAGEYSGGNARGGEAAAGAPHHRRDMAPVTRGGAVAARWAHNPKVGGSNPSPATHSDTPHRPTGGGFAVPGPNSGRHETCPYGAGFFVYRPCMRSDTM